MDVGAIGGTLFFQTFNPALNRPEHTAAVPEGKADGGDQSGGKGPEQGEAELTLELLIDKEK